MAVVHRTKIGRERVHHWGETLSAPELATKANAEATYFERQALSAERFLSEDANLDESQAQLLSPVDSLDVAMAELSQQLAGESLRPSAHRHPPVCEAEALPSVSQITQSLPQSGASSRLSFRGGNVPLVDSASAPRTVPDARNARSPGVARRRTSRDSTSLRLPPPRGRRFHVSGRLPSTL